MIGTVDIKTKVPTACARWCSCRRASSCGSAPSKKGTFNCAKSNAVQVKADLIGS